MHSCLQLFRNTTVKVSDLPNRLLKLGGYRPIIILILNVMLWNCSELMESSRQFPDNLLSVFNIQAFLEALDITVFWNYPPNRENNAMHFVIFDIRGRIFIAQRIYFLSSLPYIMFSKSLTLLNFLKVTCKLHINWEGALFTMRRIIRWYDIVSARPGSCVSESKPPPILQVTVD